MTEEKSEGPVRGGIADIVAADVEALGRVLADARAVSVGDGEEEAASERPGQSR